MVERKKVTLFLGVEKWVALLLLWVEEIGGGRGGEGNAVFNVLPKQDEEESDW